MEINICNPGEELLLETQKGEIERVVQLINEKVNINHQDGEGNTALHYAVRYGYLGIVKCLLKNGADINIENALVETPLDIADKTSRLNIEEIEMELYETVIEKSFNLIEKFVAEENSDGGNSPKKESNRNSKILDLRKEDLIKDNIQSYLEYIKDINKDFDPGCSKFIYKRANAFIFFLDTFQIPQIEGMEKYSIFNHYFPTLRDDLELIKTVRHCLYKGSNKLVAIDDIAKLVQSDLDPVTFFKKLEDYVAYACNEIHGLRTTTVKTTHLGSILKIDEDIGTNCNDGLKENLTNLLKIVGNTEGWTEERTHEILFNFLVNIPPEGDEEVCGLDSLRRSVINIFHTHKYVDSILQRELTKAVFELRSILFKYYYAKEVTDILHSIKPGEDHHKIDSDLRRSLNKTEEEFENTFNNVGSTLSKTFQKDAEYSFFQSSLNPTLEELALSVMTRHYFKYMTIIDDDETAIFYENTGSRSSFNIRRVLINEFINLRHSLSSMSNEYFKRKKDLRDSLVAYNGVKKVMYKDLCQIHLEKGSCQDKNGSSKKENSNKLKRSYCKQTENTSNQDEVKDRKQENKSHGDENTIKKEENNGNNEENNGNKEDRNSNKVKNMGKISESNSNIMQNDLIEEQITNTLISLRRLQRYYQVSYQNVISLYECVVEGNGEFDIASNSDILSKWIAPKDEKPRFKTLKNHIKKWHKLKFVEFYLNDEIITLNAIHFISNILRTFYDAMSSYNIKFVNVKEAFCNQTVLTNLIKQETKFWKEKDLKGYYLFMIFKKLLKLKYAEPFIARLIIEEGTCSVMEKEDLIKIAEGLIDENHIYELKDMLNVSCEEVDLYEIVYKKMFDKNLESMGPIFEDPHHLEMILKHLQKSMVAEGNDRVLTLEYNFIKYLNSVVRKASAAGQRNKALEIVKVYTKHPIAEKSLAKLELLMGKRRELRIINWLAVSSSKQNAESYEIAFENHKYVSKKCLELKTALEEIQENSVEFNALYLLNLSLLAYTMEFLEDYKGAYELYENVYQRIKNLTLYNTRVTLFVATEDRPSDFVDIIKSKNYTELLNCTFEAAEHLDILKIRANMVSIFFRNWKKTQKTFMDSKKVEINFYDENIEKFKEIYIMTKLQQPKDRNVANIMNKIAFMNRSVSFLKSHNKEVLKHRIESLQFSNGAYNLQNRCSDLPAKTTLRIIFSILYEVAKNRNSYFGWHVTNGIKNRLDEIRETFNDTLTVSKTIIKYGTQNEDSIISKISF